MFRCYKCCKTVQGKISNILNNDGKISFKSLWVIQLYGSLSNIMSALKPSWGRGNQWRNHIFGKGGQGRSGVWFSSCQIMTEKHMWDHGSGYVDQNGSSSQQGLIHDGVCLLSAILTVWFLFPSLGRHWENRKSWALARARVAKEPMRYVYLLSMRRTFSPCC